MNHHHHHHHHETESTLSFKQKLDKILRHWIRHNEDHASTYQEWMKAAEVAGLEGAAEKIGEAAGLVVKINALLQEAASAIDSKE